MEGTHHVEPLTSYVEILPVSSGNSKRLSPTPNPSILLTPSFSVSKRSSRKPSTPHSGQSSLLNTLVRHSTDPAAPLLLNPFGAAKEAAWETNKAVSHTVSDLPLAKECAGRQRQHFWNSTGTRATVASPHSLARAGSAPLVVRKNSLDAPPFKTFTSHLREQLALAEEGIEGASNLTSTNTRDDDAVAKRQTTPLHETAAPQLRRCPRAVMTATMSVPADAPLSVLAKGEAHGKPSPISVPPLSPHCVDKSADSLTSSTEGGSIVRHNSLSTNSADDDILDALSCELTALLEQAEAVAQQLSLSRRALQPEQVRILDRMRSRGEPSTKVPELCRQPASAPPLAQPHPPPRAVSPVISPLSSLPGSMNSSRSAGGRQTPSSACSAPRSPVRRMVVRAPRNLKWDHDLTN